MTALDILEWSAAIIVASITVCTVACIVAFLWGGWIVFRRFKDGE